jgi:hypothetical protein
MSDIIGAELFELSISGNRIIRYLKLIPLTLKILTRERPQQVFAQNPSIVLSFLIVLFKKHFGYTSIIDEHNAGLFPMEGKNIFLQRIAKFIVRRADWVIVSNKALGETCEEWGGNPLIMPDPLPSLFSDTPELCANEGSNYPFKITFICTWSDDEPFDSVLDSARALSGSNILFYITGNSKGKVSGPIPKNVRLTGFLKYDEYIRTLQNSNAVMVLTNRDNCLNCGAYEAVSLQKPGILSNSEDLKRYFYKGFLFTDNTPYDIVKQIKIMIEQHLEHTNNLKDLKNELSAKQIINIKLLKNSIDLNT